MSIAALVTDVTLNPRPSSARHTAGCIKYPVSGCAIVTPRPVENFHASKTFAPFAPKLHVLSVNAPSDGSFFGTPDHTGSHSPCHGVAVPGCGGNGRLRTGSTRVNTLVASSRENPIHIAAAVRGRGSGAPAGALAGGFSSFSNGLFSFGSMIQVSPNVASTTRLSTLESGSVSALILRTTTR